MKATFNDFYGQHVEVHNETSSGNIRIKVNTCSDLNQVKLKPKSECDIETDIALNEYQLKMLLAVLNEANRQIEDGYA